MSDTMPERITIGYTKDDVEQMQIDALDFYQQTVVPDLRAQLDAANARIAELEAAQRWVSVDERLPDVAEWCLVYGKHLHATPHIVNRSVTSMRLLSGSSSTVSWWIRESKLTSPVARPLVTHWMPLPPPPIADVTP